MTSPSAAEPPVMLRRPPSPYGQAGQVSRLSGSSRRGADAAPLLSVQGTLALDLRAAMRLPRTPELTVVADVADQAPSGIDDVRAWAARFAQAVVEVLGGDRPLSQLVRWTSPRIHADLARRVRILGQASPALARQRAVRPQVRSVHVFQPTGQSAEVSVHVRYGQRSRAIAARLELTDGLWRCTALELG